MSESSNRSEAFAIVGMGCVFPNAFNVDHYWQTLVRGNVSFMPPPKEIWDSTQFYSSDRRQPDKYYDEVVSYPYGFDFPKDKFKCAPSLLDGLSRREQYVYTALNECFLNIKKFSSRTKVFLGHTSMADFMNPSLLIQEMSEDLGVQSLSPSEKEQLMLLLRDVVDARSKDPSLSEQMIHKKISEAIKAVTGQVYPVSLVDAACASSLYTLDLGILELLKGTVDLAICGGISFSDPVGKVLFCRLGGSSRQGVFPFQSRADGTVFGEGAGFVGIKLLSRALRDGDTIYSVIRGLGTASDGKGKSIYAPNSDGQVLAIEKAYKSTKIDPMTLQYVEAHGTGTPAGDSVEFKSLQTFFNGYKIPKQSVGLGSVKGLFGHLGWAAGVASVIKLSLCLRNKTLVGQHHFESVNPLIDLDKSPFVINRQNSHWPDNRLEPRRACINGFGFGGTNAHLIIEEFTGKDVGVKVSAPVPDDKIVVVGVGCVLPEANSWAELSMALDEGRTLASRYPDGYKPNNIKFRIIDRSASVIDPTQFMLLEATGQVMGQLGDKILSLREEVGVFVAQANCLSKQLPHMKRVYVEAVKNRIEQDPMLSKVANLNATAEALIHTYKTEIPIPNEDSNPGIMPNVMAGRICNYFDFNGPNLSISAGFGTFSETLATAMTNLRYGKCQIAMVATANATTSSSFESLWEQWSGRPAAEMAEGALALGLMKQSDAIKQGIEILAVMNFGKVETVVTENAKFMDQLKTSSFGYLFSAPEAHLFLNGVNQVQKQKPTEPFSYTDDNGSTWKVSFSAAGRDEKKENQNFYLIDKVVASDENSFSCLRKLNIENDPYLSQHLVRGKPALPGTFMIEMVAQAFRAARPGMRIDELADIQFLRFMRPPLDVRIEAKRLAVSKDSTEYEVFLVSDKFSPKGFLLQKDIKHFSCKVKLSQGDYSQAGPSSPLFQELGTLMVDPYHEPGSDVYLSGIFKTISQMKMSSDYKWGNFDLDISTLPVQFRDGVLSPLLLDGAFRLGALTGDPGQPIPFPVSIQSMKVHSAMTDFELLKSGGAKAVFEKKSNRILIVAGSRLLYELVGFVGQSTDGQVAKSPDLTSLPQPKMKKAPVVLAPFPSQSMGRFVSTYKPKPMIQIVSAAPEKPFLIIAEGQIGSQEIKKSALAKLPHQYMDYKAASSLKAEDLSKFSEVLLLVDLPPIASKANLDQRKQVMQTLKSYHQLCQVLAENEQIKICACIGNTWQESDVHPFLGILRGFFRSLYQEISGERVRMVLIDQPCLDLAEEISREATFASDEYEVFYRHRERFVKGLQPQTSFPQESQFGVVDDSVVLFSGGGRGVGGYLSVQWARLYPNNRIAILGRSPRGRALAIQKEVAAEYGEMKLETFIKFKMKSKEGPKPIPKIVAEFHQLSGELELEECLKKLDQLGVQYEYYMCDVKDAGQVQATLQKVYDRFKAIHFVIHSAGVDSSKKIQAKSWNEFESNFNVKVEGFFNLLNGIKMDELKQWINFGSLVSYHGNSGQTDYGAANDALNTVSSYLNATSPHVRFSTLNWGSWNEVGMVVRSKAMKELMQTKHWKLLDPAEAAVGFFRELNYGKKTDAQVFIFEEGDRNGFKPFILKHGGKVG